MTSDDDNPRDPGIHPGISSPGKQATAADESAPERLRRGGNGFTRRLLRSAELDVPAAAARERTLLVAEPALEAPRARLSWRWSAHALSALAGAAAALLVVRQWPALGAQPTLTPQPEPANRPPAPEAMGPPARAEAPAPLPLVARLPACKRISVGSGRDLVIDDFEDGNARLGVTDGRSGIWRASGDGTGKQSPKAGEIAFPVRLAEPARGSRFVLQLHADRMPSGSAGLSADLAPGHCYDASAYAGVELSARGTGRVYLAAMMADLMEKKWGGLCEKDCYDQHSVPLDLTRDWRRYAVRWEELVQAGWGRSLPFDAARLLAISVSVQSADTPIDLAIDDVRFITR